MMKKQERREQHEKVVQDLKKKFGIDVAQMTPEEFSDAVKAYIGQRRQAAGSSEAGTQAINGEYLAAKTALLEILTDHRNTPSQRLRAAKFLATLPEIFEQLQWSFVL